MEHYDLTAPWRPQDPNPATYRIVRCGDCAAQVRVKLPQEN